MKINLKWTNKNRKILKSNLLLKSWWRWQSLRSRMSSVCTRQRCRGTRTMTIWKICTRGPCLLQGNSLCISLKVSSLSQVCSTSTWLSTKRTSNWSWLGWWNFSYSGVRLLRYSLSSLDLNMIQIALLCLKMIKLDSGAESPAWSVNSKLSTMHTISSSLTAMIWNTMPRWRSRSWSMTSLNRRSLRLARAVLDHHLQATSSVSQVLILSLMKKINYSAALWQRKWKRKKMSSTAIASLTRLRSLGTSTITTDSKWWLCRKILSILRSMAVL